MQYTKPTNKNELIDVLKEMYHYYRIRRESTESVTLSPLSLSTISLPAKSEEQYNLEAQTLILADITREKTKSQNQIKEEILKAETKINALSKAHEIQIEKINSIYSESQEKIRKEMAEKGLALSNLLIDKIAKLEEEKNDKIAKENANYSSQNLELEATINALNLRLSGLDEYYESLKEKEIDAKIIELKRQNQVDAQNIAKYNNSVSEKLQNSKNNIAQAKVSLELRYMQINSEGMSREMLVEIGYYEDVMKCINEYYSIMTPLQAFEDFTNDTRFALYLDDYYDEMVYAYKVKAGL